MDTEKIIQDLNRRFAAPLPEFYRRRIIFWYDEDQEFADKLDDIVLDNARIVRLTGSNAFAVKNACFIWTPVCAASKQSRAPSRKNSPASFRSGALSPRRTACLIFSLVRAVIFSIVKISQNSLYRDII